MDDSYLELPVQHLLDLLAADEQGPGGGSVAALVLAAAASLVAMVARRSAAWDGAGGVAAQALELRSRALPLVAGDAEAWREALAALAAPSGSDLEQKLARAAQGPLAIAELGADVASLAAHAAERCEGAFRGDVTAAAILAHGAAVAAENLVAINLTVTASDPRFAQAQRAARAAQEAAERALAAGL